MACRLRSLLPTDTWTRALLPVALVFIATASDRNYQTDLWHHLARGRVIVDEGALVDTDRFSFTVAGQPLQDVNWVWQVLFYRLERLGGLELVQAVNSALLALVMALLLGQAWRRSGSLAAAAGVCVAAFFGLWQLLIIRPQTFSLLLFVLLEGVLHEADRRRWLLVLPPFLLAAWANVHGGFPIGLVLIAAHALGAALSSEPGAEKGWTAVALVRRTWPWALCLAVSLAATLANPYGWHVYEYVGLTSRTASARHIDEWLPPGLNHLAARLWVLSLVAVLGLFALSGRKPTAREVCLLGCFLPLACGSVRMLAWWFLVSTPILATHLAACWPRLRDDPAAEKPSLGAGLVCCLMLGGVVLSLPWLERYNPALAGSDRGRRTEADLQAVADHLLGRQGSGRLFTRFAWGEYFGWALAPRYGVFMDGRIEIYPDEVWAAYAAVNRGRADWEEVLAGHGVDCLVLDTTGYHGELLPLVERSPRWKQIFRQGNAVVFVTSRSEGIALKSVPPVP